LGIWDNAGLLEIASALSTIVLIVGAVVEEWPKLKQMGLLIAKLVAFRTTPFERCVLRKLVSHSLGALLVVAGIAGELVFETRTFIVEDRETATLSRQAGDAERSAAEAAEKLQLATERLAAIEGRAGNLDARLDTAEKKTDEASKIAEHIGAGLRITQADLAWNGPRYVAIDANRLPFKDHLKQFSGQSFIRSVCWGQFISRGDQEIALTADNLFLALRDSGWKVDHWPSPVTMDETCGTIGEGVSIFVRSDAPKRTQDAAKMLLAVVDTVLKQGTVIITLDARELQAMKLTNMQPDTIDILVHMHPMRPTGPTNDDINLLKSDMRKLNP